jgi:hypothetical protein
LIFDGILFIDKAEACTKWNNMRTAEMGPFIDQAIKILLTTKIRL